MFKSITITDLPVSESGYDSWKSDGHKDQSDSQLSTQAFSDLSFVTSPNLQRHNDGSNSQSDVYFDISTRINDNAIELPFAEPGNRGSIIVAKGKRADVLVEEYDEEEGQEELVDYFSGSTVHKPIRIARLSPVNFRSFIKSTAKMAHSESLTDLDVDDSFSSSKGTNFAIPSSKVIPSFAEVMKEESVDEDNEPCAQNLSDIFRISVNKIGQKTSNDEFISDRTNISNSDRISWKEEAKYPKRINKPPDDSFSLLDRRTERQIQQDTYYENACDDALESCEANMSDWENF